MGIRTGSEFRESLRDGRTIYVDGQRISDVTAYPPFQGTIDTLASLYDLQHEHRDLLTYASPKTGDAVSLSFLMGDTVEQGGWSDSDSVGLVWPAQLGQREPSLVATRPHNAQITRTVLLGACSLRLTNRRCQS